MGFPGIGRSLLGSSASLPHFQMLEKNAQEAQDEQIKQQFSHHREETRQQVQNLEQALQALGEQPTTQPCPAIDGLKTEAEQMVQQTSSQLVDSVLLGGAAETEHHEIAVYEGLITKAEAMGQQEIVDLLQQNLEQEQHTLQEVESKAQQLAQREAQQVRA